MLKFIKKLFSKKPSLEKTSFKEIEVDVEYWVVHYKTELEIIMRDKKIVCAEYSSLKTHLPGYGLKPTQEESEKENPVQYFINSAYSNKVMHVNDKSTKRHNALSTDDIVNILYYPCKVTIETKTYKEKRKVIA